MAPFRIHISGESGAGTTTLRGDKKDEQPTEMRTRLKLLQTLCRRA